VLWIRDDLIVRHAVTPSKKSKQMPNKRELWIGKRDLFRAKWGTPCYRTQEGLVTQGEMVLCEWSYAAFVDCDSVLSVGSMRGKFLD
jgi:hypothetical protein